MDCNKIKNILDESFGSTLPVEIIDHLNSCQSCNDYWQEINTLSSALFNSSDLELSEKELDQAVVNINQVIDNQNSKIIPIANKYHSRWLVISRVAAVLAVIMVSYGSFQLGQNNTAVLPQPVIENSIDIFGSDLISWSDEEDQELDDETVSLLIADYTSESGINAVENLLDDLTDEEIEYLEKNFDIGDIL